ncbi:tail protein X [Tepidimonas charontis]|jgi:phage tail protein X|uniref:Phage Tail Protein X n=1 Tax=Tepidimonas charontis TaxID=2267262 RepID=A0A554XB05_9BURK|nr:tail protein X [Tepidimonas charontis]TSE33017.1 Phage Tail Protein X [Tepidimonas charontis]
MTQEIIAQEGETLDAALWRVLRRTDIAPQVLEANAQLARLPIKLPAGARILVPDLPEPPVQSIVRLWG